MSTFGLDASHLRDDDFLLVAAAQTSDRRLGAGRLDRKVANGALGERLSAAAADERQSGMENDRLEIGEATLKARLLDRINPSTRRSSGTKPTPP